MLGVFYIGAGGRGLGGLISGGGDYQVGVKGHDDAYWRGLSMPGWRLFLDARYSKLTAASESTRFRV